MTDLVLLAFVFAFSLGLGYVLISKVPQMLHTPLMSMTNAISAVTILGALLVFAGPVAALDRGLGVLALVCAAFNIVGGFVITDRMLGLFREKGPPAEPTATNGHSAISDRGDGF
jgi:NAD(P) transhydrogenase subunit alpha